MALLLNPFFEDSFEVCPSWRRRPTVTRPRRGCSFVVPRRPVVPMAFNILGDFADSDNLAVQQTKNSNEGFETLVNLRGYGPKDVDVEIDPNSRIVTVKGIKKEETANCVIQKHFQRSFTIPEDCPLDAIKTFLDKDGVLKISAPKDEKSIENKEVKEVKVGKEVIEVEDIPDESISNLNEVPSNTNSILEEKTQQEKMEIVKETETILKVPVEVEESKPEMEVESTKEVPFQLHMDIEGYDPTDVKVNFDQKSGILTVSAEKKVEQDSGLSLFSRFHRECFLDTTIFNIDQIKCDMNKNSNTLDISVPKREKLLMENEVKNIPITFKA